MFSILERVSISIFNKIEGSILLQLQRLCCGGAGSTGRNIGLTWRTHTHTTFLKYQTRCMLYVLYLIVIPHHCNLVCRVSEAFDDRDTNIYAGNKTFWTTTASVPAQVRQHHSSWGYLCINFEGSHQAPLVVFIWLFPLTSALHIGGAYYDRSFINFRADLYHHGTPLIPISKQVKTVIINTASTTLTKLFTVCGYFFELLAVSCWYYRADVCSQRTCDHCPQVCRSNQC